APLAPDYDYILHGQGEDFQKGLDAISKLTNGKIHLNISSDQTTKVLRNSKNVQINEFSGPHPAGNPGVHIHHIAPINAGDVYWTIHAQDVITIGRFFKEGKFDATRIVALTGPGVENPKYYKTLIGASIKNLAKDNIKDDKEYRFISGNALTGTQIKEDGY
ncbi:MAG: NADH:ubiquinone reductase (Na(+)-transporting) subunit A, partial [Flavobacteriales bacterium]